MKGMRIGKRFGLWLALICLVGCSVWIVQRAAASQPYAGTIGYIRNGDIYVFQYIHATDVIYNTSYLQVVGESASNLAWPPSGDNFAFASNRSGNGNILMWNVRGDPIISVTDNSSDDSSPAYSPGGTLYYVRYAFDGDTPANTIIQHKDGKQDQEVYSEPGGLCRITNLSMKSDTVALVSRDCGRSKNASIIDFTSGKEIFVGKDYCVLGAVWSSQGDKIAIIQTDCEMEATTPKIAIFDANGKRIKLFNAPDSSFGLVDWTTDGATLVYGNDSGLWLVDASDGAARKIYTKGGLPRWKPEVLMPRPAGWGPGMPTAGQGDLVDDYLAGGALVACVAIAAGLVMIAWRRRNGGDGL